MNHLFDQWIDLMHRWSIPLLRYALALVFLWFGLLKVMGASPVVGMIQQSYSFFPYPWFITVLGLWEIVIGLGLLTGKAPRTTLTLLWLQMLGTLASPIFAPHLFFALGNPFYLTTLGEFVIKNIVLVAASFVIAGYTIKPYYS